MRHLKLCYIVFLSTLLITGCLKKEGDTDKKLEEITQQHERYLKESNPDSFLTIMNTLTNTFEHLDKNYSPQITDFHHWLDEFMSSCTQNNNMLVFIAMTIKGSLKNIGHLRTWCETASTALNTSLAPYTALVDPAQIAKDNDMHTFDSISKLVENESNRLSASSESAPFAYHRLLEQIKCTLSNSTECISALFEKTIEEFDKTEALEPASLESMEAYFAFFDENKITPPISLWRYYEILATSKR